MDKKFFIETEYAQNNGNDDCTILNTIQITNDNLSIVDVTGKIVLSETITSNNVEINISCLDSGFYIVKIGDYIEKLFVK